MKKAFLILLGLTAIGSAGIIAYTYWWVYHNFDKQDKEFNW